MVEDRIEKVFNEVFRGKVVYSPELEMSAKQKCESLRRVQLMVALEKEFNLRFDGADAANMVTVEEICETISARKRS